MQPPVPSARVSWPPSGLVAFDSWAATQPQPLYRLRILARCGQLGGVHHLIHGRKILSVLIDPARAKMTDPEGSAITVLPITVLPGLSFHQFLRRHALLPQELQRAVDSGELPVIRLHSGVFLEDRALSAAENALLERFRKERLEAKRQVLARRITEQTGIDAEKLRSLGAELAAFSVRNPNLAPRQRQRLQGLERRRRLLEELLSGTPLSEVANNNGLSVLKASELTMELRNRLSHCLRRAELQLTPTEQPEQRQAGPEVCPQKPCSPTLCSPELWALANQLLFESILEQAI